MNKVGIGIAILVVVGGGILIARTQGTRDIDQSAVAVTSSPTEGVMASGPVQSGTYTVNASQSTIGWEGKKPLIKDYIQSGTLAVKEGSVAIDGNNVSGTIVFDMTTIKDDKANARLEGHLKADDFFGVEKFPTATLAIKSAERSQEGYTVTADLTLKGVTKEITFPALVAPSESGTLSITGEARVDRTEFGIRFGSGKFFSNLADNVIDDFFTVRFVLVASK